MVYCVGVLGKPVVEFGPLFLMVRRLIHSTEILLMDQINGKDYRESNDPTSQNLGKYHCDWPGEPLIIDLNWLKVFCYASNTRNLELCK